MRIEFDLPDHAADWLRSLLAHLERETGVKQPAGEIVRSMVVDLLLDDVLAHHEGAGQPN